jgi:hypothetical protein
MQGLALNSRCFKTKTSLGIREIVDCLTPEISQLYCVAHGPFLSFSSREGKVLSEEEIQKLERESRRFLLEEEDIHIVGVEVRDLKLFERGFLEKFRDYLYGDWTRLYLLTAKIPLSTIQLWNSKLPTECEILICCIDAAYWEVFARSPALLVRLKGTFAEAVPCLLEDKTT